MFVTLGDLTFSALVLAVGGQPEQVQAMSMEEDLLSNAEHNDARAISATVPWSYSSSKRCEHAADSANVEITDTHEVGSDSFYIRRRCRVCGHSWTLFVEG